MSSRPAKRLLLLLTCQQSVLASPEAIDEAVAKLYAPLLDALAAHPKQRVALHAHGYLLDRLARVHEGFLLRLKTFVAAGQIELVGGLFYGAPPSLLAETDVRGQVAMLQEFWTSFVGDAPRGMALPELALCAELPRLLEGTGLDYVFAGSDQLRPAPFVGRLRRGGHELATIALNVGLGLAYRPGEEATFAADLARATEGDEPIAVQLAVERVGEGAHGAGTDADTNPSVDAAARLGALFAGLATHEVQSLLPQSALRATQEPPPCVLVRPFAPLAEAPAEVAAYGDWSGFAAHYPEAERLYGQILQASDRLARAIATMEDESLDEAWSDALATAQRHLFATQSAEVLGIAGGSDGVCDARVRQAAEARLVQAKAVLDSLADSRHGSQGAN